MTNANKVGEFLNDNFDRAGKEIKVGKLAQVVGLVRDDGVNFALTGIFIFSTATDCTGAFDWATASTFTAPVRIPIGLSPKNYSGFVKA